jgi:hypothetical protein
MALTHAQIRHTAWTAHDQIEWLDRHVQARSTKDNRKLEDILTDLHKKLMRIIDAPLRDEPDE